MCLPNNPKYDKYIDSWEKTGAICGTEYEVSFFNPFTNNLHNYDAPCAVCYVRSRASQLMMPARNVCAFAWVKEYHGYLKTAHYLRSSTRDFICVDIGRLSMSQAPNLIRIVHCYILCKEVVAPYRAFHTFLEES